MRASVSEICPVLNEVPALLFKLTNFQYEAGNEKAKQEEKKK